MTPQSELEITGSLRFHPFADLVAEIQQNRLNGSLRISAGDRKCVAYFKAGKLVFAVSNARSSRLFSILLEHKRVKKEDILEFPKYINDFELVAYLETKKLISRP